jgi:outer membrane protein
MKKHMNSAVKLLVLAAAMGAASGASAQSAGEWMVKVGLNKIKPHVDSEPITAPALPNSLADIGEDVQPVVTIGRMLTDNISAELDLGTPYKHKLYGAGGLQGTGVLATSEVLPPTAFIQYRFLSPDSKFRPYAGLGATYAMFRHETGSGQLTALLNPGGTPVTFAMKSKWAATAQIGATWAFKENWFADISYAKTRLKTSATFSTGQMQKARLDPSALSIGVGYSFR